MARSSFPPLVKTKERGIYKRGGRYVVVYRDPNGRQRKRFAKTLGQARDEKAKLRADVARGEYRESSRVTFVEYATDWLTTYRGRTSRGFSESTREDYQGALDREAIPFFGRRRLVEIEPRTLKSFLAYLEEAQPNRDEHPRVEGLSIASVRKTIAPVRALLATAVEEGLLRSNPAAGLRIARPLDDAGDVDETEEVKALTEDELRLLLGNLPDTWRPFFEFLAHTGLRIGEAIELRWRDVDGEWLHVRRRFSRGTVAKPKGRKTRRVRLSEGTAKMLWNLRKETRAGAGDDLVFTAERGGRIIPSNLMSRVLKPAAVQAGIGDWPGFHTFRHTAATMLFRAGWNAVQVQKVLGHADAGFTLRCYVHLLPEDLPEPAFLDAITGGVGNAWATRASENTRNAGDAAETENPANSDLPRTAEIARSHS
jgi:integrase